ncbi:histidine phosphatase family protein [Cellulomonas sp. URHD0024]|uniref:SixA phosphatase family protein n=1 Tax=Cellulomonas sp. URHD0024 TaxID=1302620 RepID=UPI0003F975FA|nr:histidine phosphatase family protein [Cellulomonas sp. URHD0024]
MTLDPGTRNLILLRHAKAEHPEHMEDIQRPLSLVGRRQAGRVGTALAADALVPDLVLCSSSVRTRQTWELARATLGAAPEVRFDEALYYAGVREVLEIVQTISDDVRTLLVVGHEPTMSHLAVGLAGPDSDPTTLARVRVGVPTASWSLLTVATPWGALEPGDAGLRRLTLAE